MLQQLISESNEMVTRRDQWVRFLGSKHNVHLATKRLCVGCATVGTKWIAYADDFQYQLCGKCAADTWISDICVIPEPKPTTHAVVISIYALSILAVVTHTREHYNRYGYCRVCFKYTNWCMRCASYNNTVCPGCYFGVVIPHKHMQFPYIC